MGGGDGRASSGTDCCGRSQGNSGSGYWAQRSKPTGTLGFFQGGFWKAQTPAHDFHRTVGLFAQKRADVANLIVNRFEGHIAGHDPRNVVLQSRAKNAAGNRDNKKPHQQAREGAAKMKTAMKEN